ncbi:MAG: riboflavin kinase [Acidimicrobiales bacterium]
MNGEVLSGVVVRGDQRGRELGFPTANVELDPGGELPEDGVYRGSFEREDGARHLAAVSVGSRPTYYGEHGVRLVEAYLLDFDEDLYGEHVRVVLHERVRGQVRYEGSESLVAQMRLDVEAVRSGGAR